MHSSGFYRTSKPLNTLFKDRVSPASTACYNTERRSSYDQNAPYALRPRIRRLLHYRRRRRSERAAGTAESDGIAESDDGIAASHDGIAESSRYESAKEVPKAKRLQKEQKEEEKQKQSDEYVAGTDGADESSSADEYAASVAPAGSGRHAGIAMAVKTSLRLDRSIYGSP